AAILSPIPDESNRRLTSRVASLHLAPTVTSRSNLVREGVRRDDIVVTGNTVIDALMYATEHFAVRFGDPRLEALRSDRSRGRAGRVLQVTAHRRENLGSATIGVGLAIAERARRYPDLTVVFPVHRNPQVRAA